LEKVLKANHHRTPQQVAEKVFADIDHFRGATPLTDDQTIIALRVL
jgi:serine phosphatase RsbU (regulator of sigma subunit)